MAAGRVDVPACGSGSRSSHSVTVLSRRSLASWRAYFAGLAREHLARSYVSECPADDRDYVRLGRRPDLRLCRVRRVPGDARTAQPPPLGRRTAAALRRSHRAGTRCLRGAVRAPRSRPSSRRSCAAPSTCRCSSSRDAILPCHGQMLHPKHPHRHPLRTPTNRPRRPRIPSLSSVRWPRCRPTATSARPRSRSRRPTLPRRTPPFRHPTKLLRWHPTNRLPQRGNSRNRRRSWRSRLRLRHPRRLCRQPHRSPKRRRQKFSRPQRQSQPRRQRPSISRQAPPSRCRRRSFTGIRRAVVSGLGGGASSATPPARTLGGAAGRTVLPATIVRPAPGVSRLPLSSTARERIVWVPEVEGRPDVGPGCASHRGVPGEAAVDRDLDAAHQAGRPSVAVR